MKISAHWIRDFVSPTASDRDVAEALTVSGIAIEGYFGEGADQTWEAEITTNRVDAMNHYGVAREVSAIYDLDLAPIAPKISESGNADFPIVIEDAEGCARYTARVVRGVKISPAPEKIVHRLELIDQRSISNVADASNYVLNEIGHPTHAFDRDKLEGRKIIVRRAREGESITTLDGVERKLLPEDLVIADAVKPVAIAGVMGGEATMITDATRNVLIESAWFDPASIRRTARRLGMHTDASHRYERGADCGITRLACARVAELIVASAGGVVSTEIDVVARTIPQPRIALASSEVKRILGVEIPPAEIARILGRLGFKVEGSGPEFTVTVPTWRLDVGREIDLIEEIARITPTSKFPARCPRFPAEWSNCLRRANRPRCVDACSRWATTSRSPPRLSRRRTRVRLPTPSRCALPIRSAKRHRSCAPRSSRDCSRGCLQPESRQRGCAAVRGRSRLCNAG